MAKPASSSDRSAQIDRFKKAARALGCDKDEAAFDAKLGVIAKQQPADAPKVKPKAKPTK